MSRQKIIGIDSSTSESGGYNYYVGHDALEGVAFDYRVYSKNGFDVNVGDYIVAEFAQGRDGGLYIRSLRKEVI